MINFSDFLGAPGIQLPSPDLSAASGFSILPSPGDLAKLAPGIQLAGIMPGEWDWMNKVGMPDGKQLAAAGMGLGDILSPNAQQRPIQFPSVSSGSSAPGGLNGRATMTQAVNRNPVSIPKLTGGR